MPWGVLIATKYLCAVYSCSLSALPVVYRIPSRLRDVYRTLPSSSRRSNRLGAISLLSLQRRRHHLRDSICCYISSTCFPALQEENVVLHPAYHRRLLYVTHSILSCYSSDADHAQSRLWASLAASYRTMIFGPSGHSSCNLSLSSSRLHFLPHQYTSYSVVSFFSSTVRDTHLCDGSGLRRCLLREMC
jgi:hypothetical protein